MEATRNISNHQVLSEYYSFINSCAKKFYPVNSLSEDVSNDVYLKLFEQPTNKLLRLIYQGKIKNYIYVVTHNHVCDLQRLSKLRINAESDSIDCIPDIDFSDELMNVLNKLNDDEVKFLSVLVNEKDIVSLHKRLDISRKSIYEKLNKIKSKL